jgi:NAD(P)H-dependent flavin oxidoreductase YrpB (nitropropane dioxygenase family)
MLSTPFTKLTGCRVPLQLAGMPVVTLELATAVAEAGGLPTLSTLRAPTPFLTDTLEKAISRTGTQSA